MKRSPRRNGAAIGAVALFVLCAAQLSSQVGQFKSRALVNPGGAAMGRFALMLDKAFSGFLRDFEGGGARGAVVEFRSGNTLKTKKSLGALIYGEMKLEVPVSMGQPLFNWISQTWSGKSGSLSGAVVETDLNNNAVSQLEFTNGLITETTIPAMDTGAKQPGFLTVKIAPETTRRLAATGKVSGGQVGLQKTWIPSNFRLAIAGLDCSKVTKIEAFTVKQGISVARIGDGRTVRAGPIKLEIPNLVFYMPEVFAKPFFDWHEDFAIKGNNKDDKERAGSLQLLDASLQQALLTVTFSHLGIVSVDSVSSEATGGLRRVRVELYGEEMILSR